MGQTKRNTVRYLWSVLFWTQFEGLVVTWDITLIYTISEMVSISILSILCIFEVHIIISGELTDERFKIPAKKKQGLVSVVAPEHGLNNRANRDALLYRFLKTHLKPFLLNRTLSKLELDVTSENLKTVESLKKQNDKFHIFSTPSRTTTKKPNHKHEFETKKVYNIEQNYHHYFSTPYDILKSSMKKLNKQTQKNPVTTEKLDLFFPSLDEIEQNDFKKQSYKYDYSTLVYDHTAEKTSSTKSTDKVSETIYPSSSSQLITSTSSTTSQPILYTLNKSEKAQHYKENAKRNYKNKFIKKLTYADLFNDQTTDNGVNKLNQIEFPLTSTMKAKIYEDETKSNEIYEYINNYKNDYSGLVYDSVKKQTSSAEELTDDFFEQLDVVDGAYLNFNTNYDDLRKRTNIAITPHLSTGTATTTITPTRTNRFYKNKHESMHKDYIKNMVQSIKNRRKRRTISKMSLNEALTKRRFKRGSNVIEEENIGSTVAGFKFTGRPSIYHHQLTFKNINT